MSYAFFFEMAWKSALIAGAALLLASLLRSRSAADRAALLRLAVGLVLLLPFISLLLPSLQVEMAAAVVEPAPQALPYTPIVSAPETASAASLPLAAAEPTIWDDPTPLVILLYAGGLLMIGFRIVAGLWTLRGWTAAASEMDCPQWNGAFRRVLANNGTERSISLRLSDEAPSPMSWGWRRPVILIDRDTFECPEDAEAVLAHEMAHIVRNDWPALMLSRAAVALFWFNPLVWWLERAVIDQAEEAADSFAVSDVEPTDYAQVLLKCARNCGHNLVPANSMATPGLARRVKAVLEARGRSIPSGSRWTFAAMLLCIAFAAPVAALELVDAVAPPSPPAAPKAPEAPQAPERLEAPEPPEAPAPHRAARHMAVPVPPAPPAIVHPEIEIDGDEIARNVEAAMQARFESRDWAREAERMAAQATRQAAKAGRLAHVEARKAMRFAEVETRRAMKEARRSMALGAKEMERGADDMERGAREMREEAAKLRRRDYREQVIAREAARGERVTHEQLLEAAEGLEEGAEGMVDGARDMRQGAVDMRNGDND